MRDYFKRLKEHPGLAFATFLTGMGFLAGATNKHMDFWTGGLIGLLIMGVFSWGLVLLSNFKR